MKKNLGRKLWKEIICIICSENFIYFSIIFQFSLLLFSWSKFTWLYVYLWWAYIALDTIKSQKYQSPN